MNTQTKLEIFNKIKSGGKWLGAARTWMQSNIRNGDTLTWSSPEQVSIPFCELENFALEVACAAIEEDRKINGRDFAFVPRKLNKKLEKPAMVGAGIFREGVDKNLVIEAAQRQYEYQEKAKALKVKDT
jgi:hypothetical protein